MYKIVLSPRAAKELNYFEKRNKRYYQKVLALIGEIAKHPYTGTGRPEQLKYDLSGCWSRRIDDEHRLVYSVDEGVVMVYVFSMRHHYA